jgi:hypothetical protein
LIYNSGSIYDNSAVSAVELFGTNSSFTNSASGALQGSAYLNASGSSLDNAGTIDGGPTYGGITFEAGSESVMNSGAVDGAVFINGGNSSIDNTGVVEGGITIGGGNSSIVNSGSIIGGVSVAGGYIDSTNGSITMGSDGGVIIGGDTGGSISGGSGNDVLYANPTQTAATDAAQTTLDGGTGNNWLYGDGAITTFMSGDNAKGTYNQIFGGQSEMADDCRRSYATSELAAARLHG